MILLLTISLLNHIVRSGEYSNSSPTEQALDWWNSPCQHLRECLEKIMMLGWKGLILVWSDLKQLLCDCLNDCLTDSLIAWLIAWCCIIFCRHSLQCAVKCLGFMNYDKRVSVEFEMCVCIGFLNLYKPEWRILIIQPIEFEFIFVITCAYYFLKNSFKCA